mgnify:CR=1 FL=1
MTVLRQRELMLKECKHRKEAIWPSLRREAIRGGWSAFSSRKEETTSIS